MLLFICHASEDRDDFVRPLAEALRKEYEKVWYSEYELTMGDNLLQKIDQGLATCNYGIVVLSKSFFKKKWPPAELAGLFTRETESRKIILPIWKDITAEEVGEYSPILASKFAVSTTAGLPEVLKQIRLAVGISERQRELTAIDRAEQRVEALRHSVAKTQRVEQLLRSQQGADLVRESLENVWGTIQRILCTNPDPSAPIKFRCSRPTPNTMYVGTVRGMYLNLHPTNVHIINSVEDTRLEAKIFQRHFDDLGQPVSDAMVRRDMEFQPTFGSSDEVIWLNRSTNATYTTDELAAHLIEFFVEDVQKEVTSKED